MLNVVSLSFLVVTPHIEKLPISPAAVSGDGRFVVGSKWSGPGRQGGYIWSRDGRMVKLPPPPGSTYVNPTDISDDGQVVVGYATFAKKWLYCLWKGAGKPKVIETIDFVRGDPILSGDGKWVFFAVGRRWSQKTGFEAIGFVKDGDNPAADVLAVSRDGSVFVGACSIALKYPHPAHDGLCELDSSSMATIWQKIDQPKMLGRPAPAISTLASACSANGSTIAGWASTRAGDRPFIWTAVTGLRFLQVPPKALSITVRAITSDGRTVFGVQQTGEAEIGLMWTDGQGPVRLIDQVRRRGAPVNSRWRLQSIEATSGSGRVIVGSDSVGEGDRVPWVLTW